jgi:hypothetical protein
MGASVAGASDPLPVRTCEQRADSGSSNPALTPGSGDLFVGRRVMLVGAAAPKTHDEKSQVPGKFWFKSLAVVRAGRNAQLSIPASERGPLALQYAVGRNGSLRTTARIELQPCPASVHKWTYFPGGFVYSERGCYAIDIRIAGSRAKRYWIPLGAGATCPPT